MPKRRQPISRGQAEAVLKASGGGGLQVLRGKPPIKVGAPADATGLAAIRPLTFEDFDNKRYCALDWHVILLGLFYPSSIFTRETAKADAAISPITLTLDGSVLDTTRTPLKSKRSAASRIVMDSGRM